ncbi:MAG: response regulator, partial [Armatimonadota bacterium]|nr:response regulator [Armatimonadota bacterium]
YGSMGVWEDGRNSATPTPTPPHSHTPIRYLRVSVSDSGIGIKPEDQERIFGEFEQVDSSYARQQQGTGLGLTLTKRLVELHGGRIWIESEGIEGKGSTFSFALPLEEPPVVDETAPAGTEEETLPADGLKVLVVEDNHPASELLTHYLTEAGYRVIHAYDGEQAVQMVHDLHPDAVTLDIMLPKKDGWQVLAEIKSAPDTTDVPVVIVSMTDDRQLGFTLGAMDFLVKPVDKNRLVEAVAKATHGKPDITVLVVDDEPKTVELLTDLLQHEGFGVLQAFGGQQGIDLALQRIPDLIILDLMMPEVTGFDVVQRLREHAQAREIPILIFTAKDITAADRDRLNSHIRAIVPKSGKEDLLRELERFRKMREG